MPKFPSDWCISVKKPEVAKPWVKKRRALHSSFVFAKNLSLVSSSIVLHGTRVYQARVLCGIFSIKKSKSTQVFFMKLECLKLDLHSKLEF